jgi:hypothetical protein
MLYYNNHSYGKFTVMYDRVRHKKSCFVYTFIYTNV